MWVSVPLGLCFMALMTSAKPMIQDAIEFEKDHFVHISSDESTEEGADDTMPAGYTTPDITTHDCNTIRPFVRNKLVMDPVISQGRSKWKSYRGLGALAEVDKYNHAYGLPIIGTKQFTDDAMRRLCYLVRYMFADNEWVRRKAYKVRTVVVGFRGGRCCPAQAGIDTMICPCRPQPHAYLEGKTTSGAYPFLGQAAPAHEMGHWFLKHIFPALTTEGLFKLPEFVDTPGWTYRQPVNQDKLPDQKKFSKCDKAESMSRQYGKFFDFLWNSAYQDKTRKSSVISPCKYHHYFLYSGQDKWHNWGAGAGPLRVSTREKMMKTNPNLYNLDKAIWSCNNDYIPPCRDAAYGFTLGLSQKMLIGKASKEDSTKMECKEMDIAEREVGPISTPTEDLANVEGKCRKVLHRAGWLKEKKQPLDQIPEGLVQQSLQEVNEYAWYLRKCCFKTAKFNTTSDLAGTVPVPPPYSGRATVTENGDYTY